MALRDVMDNEKVEIIGSNMDDEERDEYADAPWSDNRKAEILNGGLREATQKVLDSLEDVAPERLCPKSFYTKSLK